MSANTVRTARRRTLRIAAAALTAAAGLALTACSSSDDAGTKASHRTGAGTTAADSGGTGSSAGAQGSDTTAGSSAGAQGSDAKAGSSSGAQGSGTTAEAGRQPGGSHAAPGGQAGSGVQRCHTSGLKAAFAMGEDAAPDPNADGATTTSVVLTNTSGRSCKIGGFAGVDLKSENGGQVWSLQRSSAKYGSITLGPGDSTDFTINLALAKEDEEHTWMPAFVAVTPPNETTSLTLKWPWGPLVDQTGATHPATFVNPIG
ncbi:flagellar motor protein MotB [Streptomyces albus subsp. albus]|nr:flagellar motor protein MotB [Streptomyces albus subsp. albus]